MAAVVDVDDNDSRISYTGSWYPGGNPSTEYDGTTHGANSDGASFTFAFTGTSVSVFGTVSGAPTDNGTSTVNFMIDNGSPESVVTPLSPIVLYQHQYYTSQLLDGNQPHQLKVTVSPYNGSNIFWFDYIQYTPFTPSTPSQAQSPPPVTTAPPPPPPTTPSPPSSSPSPVSSPAQAPPPSSNPPSSSASPVPPSNAASAYSTSAAAAGSSSTAASLGSSAPPTTLTTTASAGASAAEVVPTGQGKTTSNLSTVLPAAIVPSCVLLLALLALLLWWRKYRAKKRYLAYQSEKEDILGPGSVNPQGNMAFPYRGGVNTPGSATGLLSGAHPQSPPSSHTESSRFSAPSIYSPQPAAPGHNGMLAAQISSSTAAIQAIQDEKSDPQQQRAPARLRSIHHVDGGVRLDGGPTSDSGVDVVQEHPPQYREY